MPDIIKRRCGTCKKWKPGTTYEETIRAKRKGVPHCEATGDTKGPESEKGCFLWKLAEEQELDRREKAGHIKLEAAVESI